MKSSITDQQSKGAGDTLVLELPLPQGTDPAMSRMDRGKTTQGVVSCSFGRRIPDPPLRVLLDEPLAMEPRRSEIIALIRRLKIQKI